MELRGCRRVKKPIFGFFSRHYYNVWPGSMQTEPEKSTKKRSEICCSKNVK